MGTADVHSTPSAPFEAVSTIFRAAEVMELAQIWRREDCGRMEPQPQVIERPTVRRRAPAPQLPQTQWGSNRIEWLTKEGSGLRATHFAPYTSW